MGALKNYLDAKNKYMRVFGDKILSIGSHAERQTVADHLSGDLSPENISCDGELPRSVVAARYRKLNGALKELQKLDPFIKVNY